VSSVGATIRTGRSARAAIDRKRREIEVKVTGDEFARLRIKLHGPDGDWNVTISPQS